VYETPYMWACMVVVTSRGAAIQLPTFYLDPNVQGITGMEHAASVAREIVNPTGAADIEINVTACRVTREY